MNPCEKLRQALRAEKAPYIITIAFAGLGWTVIHTVERLEKIPVLEYDVDGPSKGTSGKLIYTVTNLSQETFRGLFFYIRPTRDGHPMLSSPEELYEPPAMANPSYNMAATMDKDTAAFQIYELQPRWSVQLQAAAKSGEADLVYYVSEDAPRVGGPFQLFESGFTTWLIRY